MLDPRLNYFVAVVRYGSFTAAARAVGVTQSAITKNVADLERQLGLKLFYRTARGAKVTEKGRQIAERAARLLDDAHELLRVPAAKGVGFSGSLRVGLCPASLEWCLAQPVARFQARHADVRFEITGASFTRMIQHLESGAVDMVIGFEVAFGEWPDVQRQLIGEMSIIPFVRQGHPLRGKGAVSAAELAHYDLVAPTDWRPYGDVIRGIYQSHWRERVHLIDNFAVTQALVASSDVIGLAASAQVENPAFKRQFSTLGKNAMFKPERLCCATRAHWETTQEVRALMSMLRQALLEVRDGALRTDAVPELDFVAAGAGRREMAGGP